MYVKTSRVLILVFGKIKLASLLCIMTRNGRLRDELLLERTDRAHMRVFYPESITLHAT